MYLELIKKHNLNPNFWCSKEYWKHAKWEEKHTKNWCWVVDSEQQIMLPKLNILECVSFDIYWAGFSNCNFLHSKFLDYEFIYEPCANINYLNGKKWRTTRKNINKFKRERGEIKFNKNIISEDIKADLLFTWVEFMNLKTIEDDEVMGNYILKGENQIAIINDTEIVGLIIYDYNFKYVNFRYCIVKPYWGLSDYARLSFRQYVYENYPGKLINDGGCLGKDSLQKYKERLVPKKINKIWSLL